MERLNEKEDELAELRAQLNRKDRKPKSGITKDQEHQRRLNRLTVDLENDRLLMQKLEELNHQLEVNTAIKFCFAFISSLYHRRKSKNMKLFSSLMPRRWLRRIKSWKS